MYSSQTIIPKIDAPAACAPLMRTPDVTIVETGKPDEFYGNLTDLVAGGQFGAVEEVTSPDDNLQAVFKYLVKQ